jgi:hypothetical protein
MSTELPQGVIEEIRAAIFAGKKIQAIKVYRTAANTGLKEAKEFIERLTERLYEESPDEFSSAPGGVGCAGVLLIGAVVFVAGYWTAGVL